MRAGVCLVSSSRLADCRATYGPRSERHFNSLLASNKKLKRLAAVCFPHPPNEATASGQKLVGQTKLGRFDRL
jgi:hypothetical protein